MPKPSIESRIRKPLNEEQRLLLFKQAVKMLITAAKDKEGMAEFDADAKPLPNALFNRLGMSNDDLIIKLDKLWIDYHNDLDEIDRLGEIFGNESPKETEKIIRKFRDVGNEFIASIKAFKNHHGAVDLIYYTDDPNSIASELATELPGFRTYNKTGNIEHIINDDESKLVFNLKALVNQASKAIKYIEFIKNNQMFNNHPSKFTHLIDTGCEESNADHELARACYDLGKNQNCNNFSILACVFRAVQAAEFGRPLESIRRSNAGRDLITRVSKGGLM